jgi:hypothetical protein
MSAMTPTAPPVSSDARRRALVLLIAMVVLTAVCTVIAQRGEQFFGVVFLPFVAWLVALGAGSAGLRAPGLLCDPGRRMFEVPPNYLMTATSTMTLLAPAAVWVRVEWRWAQVAIVVVIVVGVGLSLGDTVRRRPRVELTPDELRFRSRFTGYDVPWTAISAQAVRRGRLRVEQPERVVGHGLARRAPRSISARTYSVVWRNLGEIVERYLNQPQLREHIGTAAEYAELNDIVDKASRVYPYWTGPRTRPSR